MTNAKSITRYFHGSNRGLKVGEYILPPLVTGRDSLGNYGAHKVCRKDRVYVSVAQTDAQGFACRSENKDPVVYEVEPEGELEVDPDCASGVSFACEKASRSQDIWQEYQEGSQGDISEITPEREGRAVEIDFVRSNHAERRAKARRPHRALGRVHSVSEHCEAALWETSTEARIFCGQMLINVRRVAAQSNDSRGCWWVRARHLRLLPRSRGTFIKHG